MYELDEYTHIRICLYFMFETSYFFVDDMLNRILSNRRCALPCDLSSALFVCRHFRLKNVRTLEMIRYKLGAEAFV